MRYIVYLDTKDIPTPGVEHNLRARPPPAAWTYPFSDEQVDQLIEQDLEIVYDELDRNPPRWRDFNYARRRVICNMFSNLGITKLLGFVNTLAAMHQGRYADAARGMLNSALAEQVGIYDWDGLPGRVLRLANMMKGGK
ncbi:lysozyme family protein [Paraburkholderia strydomiana]|uniref:lysozyme n=1 Tax=Paraburkholderia strydomiana TaxID=1245417 RepID=UPI0038BD2E82